MDRKSRRVKRMCVEELEGRVAPTIYGLAFRVVPHHPQVVEVSGHTAHATGPGDYLVITIIYTENAHPFRDYSSSATSTVHHNGTFAAPIAALNNLPWSHFTPDEVTISSYHPGTNQFIETGRIFIHHF
jgi:hypothetical protein